METYTRDNGSNVEVPRRVSWGAIFAGLVTALAVQLVLGLFASSWGSGTLDFAQEKQPFSGLGTGTIIWAVVSSLLSLFAGGWVASHLAGRSRQTDHVLHGVVTWGLTSLAMFYLLTTTVGAVLTGAFGVIGKSVSFLGRGVTQAVQAAGLGEMPSLDLSEIKQEAKTLLAQTGKKELQPDQLESTAKRMGNQAEAGAESAAKNPQQADQTIEGVIDRVLARSENVLEEVDQEAIVNVLVARTDMSKVEAQKTVSRWTQTAQDAAQKVKALRVQAEEQAIAAADETARAVSQASLWAAIFLLISGIAAALGGYVGGLPDKKSVTPNPFTRSEPEPRRASA